MEPNHRPLSLYTRAMCVVAILGVSTNAVAAATCPAQTAAMTDNIASFLKLSKALYDRAQSDYESATSYDFAHDTFDAFEELNAKAGDAQELINNAYDLSGFVYDPDLDDVQSKIPPVITTTMSNAEELVQAMLDDQNTRLDIADLRCSQDTEQAALQAYLENSAPNTANIYSEARDTFCSVIHILADLQDKRQKLNDIRENGYPLWYLHAKDTKTFASTYSRTIQYKADLRIFPEYPEDVFQPEEIEGMAPIDQPVLLGQADGLVLSFNTYFKWSDDDWHVLNLYQYVISDSRSDEYICPVTIPLTGSVDVKFCAKVTEFQDDSLTVDTKAEFHYKGDHKSVSIGSVEVPAPFGYIADLSDMKEDAMGKLQDKLADKLSDFAKAHDELVEMAGDWADACEIDVN